MGYTENILLDSKGHVRIADFSISRREITETAKLMATVGTYGYIAPEVRFLIS